MTADLIQGSPEWIAARVGRFGASVLGALMAKGEGKTRMALIEQIACERLTGRPQGWEGNAATESGHQQEPLASRAYEDRHGVFVETVGLILHPEMPFTHASPDGLVDDDGGLEIKSHVRFLTHFRAIRSGMSKGHLYQVQWGMACTDRVWWDYGHYCADAPEGQQLFMFPRVKRDDKVIAELTTAIRDAEAEVSALVETFSRRAA